MAITVGVQSYAEIRKELWIDLMLEPLFRWFPTGHDPE